MTRSELTQLHEDICNRARKLQVAKNHDYAHEGDIFRNFRRYGTFGVLVRLSDKLARLDSFEENKEFAVADEKLEDTIVDIINYATIYLAMKQETSPPVYSGAAVERRIGVSDRRKVLDPLGVVRGGFRRRSRTGRRVTDTAEYTRLPGVARDHEGFGF